MGGRGRGHTKGGPRGGCQRGSGSVPPFWMPPASNQFDLMNIGQAVRAALDPFGVDVDISVETPAKKSKKSESATEANVDKAKEAKEDIATKASESTLPKEDTDMETNETPKTVEKEDQTENVVKRKTKTNLLNQDVEMVNTGVKAMEITETPQFLETPKPAETPAPVETPKIPDEPKDTDEGWTVLDRANSASASPNRSPSASASPKPETRGAEAIYPKLENVPDLSGLSPKIKIALQAMENMGFTNEEGWLSNLLVKYDGDIGKVLDLLAPANRA